jgi:hypothetical protein
MNRRYRPTNSALNPLPSTKMREARAAQGPVGRASDSKFAMRPQIRPAVRELPRTLPDDKAQLFVAYSRVFLEFFALSGRPWILPEACGFGTAGHRTSGPSA